MEPVLKKVLIIEDDELIRQVLSDKFKTAGFSAYVATNGEAGLSMALSHKPDVIILDIIMPKMDGLETLKKLREDPWGKNAVVFVVSSLSDSFDMNIANKFNIMGYFVKEDWNPDDLVRRVKEKVSQVTPQAR